MRNIIVLLLTTMALLLSSQKVNAEERQIEQNELPKSAQFILASHFADSQINTVSITDKKDGYRVKFIDKTVILFNVIGDWVSIDCQNSPIPFMLVPSWIRNQIAEKFGPKAYPVKMDKNKKKKIRLKLDNGIELEMK